MAARRLAVVSGASRQLRAARSESPCASVDSDFRSPISDFRLPTSRPRRGITLLEILVSIFVLTIGLLGIAALIPVGNDAVTKASILHRAGEVGRRAFREARIRGFHNPSLWMLNGQPLVNPDTQEVNQQMQSLKCIVIDPLTVARASGSSTTFPYVEGPSQSLLTNLGGIPVLSLRNGFDPRQNASAMMEAQARDIFISRDNLVFYKPVDSTQPAQQFEGSQASESKRQSESVYSWMLTLVPHPSDPQMYTMTAVVFYRNMPQLTGERKPRSAILAQAAYLGGLDFRLTCPDPDLMKYLRVGRWIMLTDGKDQFKWYRVQSLETMPGNEIRNPSVSLDGPDWENVRGGAQPIAVIYDGCVGAFQKTIELEGPTLWQRGLTNRDGAAKR